MLPVLNTSYCDQSLSRWQAEMIKGYVIAQNLIPEAEAKAWFSEFGTLDERGAYWFASLPMMTEAIRI